MVEVGIKLLSKLARLPQKMTEHAAGYDIFSANDKSLEIESGKLVLISTGFSMELPIGFEAQIRPRSGLALKNQIGVLNSPGTIDSDYRGEVKIILYNFGSETFIVETGMRIAQMVISKHEIANFTIQEELNETSRNSGSFGHTKV